MESASSFPSKTTRKLLEEDIGKPIIECKREFKLTRQFPSRVYKKKPASDLAPSQISNKLLGKGDVNKLNKIRIKTQDGKDLGEFKLKLLPPELINETLISNSLHLANNIKMPITLLFEDASKLKNIPQTIEVAPIANQLYLNVNKEKSNSKKLEKMLVNDVQYISHDSLNKGLSNLMFLPNENQYSKLCNTEAINSKTPQYKITVQNKEVLIPLNKLPNSRKVIKRKANSDNTVTNKKISSHDIVAEREATSDNTVTKTNSNSDNVIVKRGGSIDNAVVKKKPLWNNLDNIEESTLKENGVETAFMKVNILRKPKLKISLGNKLVPIIFEPQKSISMVCSPEKSISKVCVPEKPISKESVSEKLVSKKLVFKDCVLEKIISEDCVPKESLSDVTASEKSISKCNTRKRPKIEATAAEEPTIVVNASENSILQSEEHQSLIQSKFPVVACEKLVISKTKVAVNRIDQVISKIDSNKLNSSLAQNVCLVKDNESDQCSNIAINCEVQITQNAGTKNEAQTSSNVRGTFTTETTCNALEKNCNIAPASNDTNIITLYSSIDKSKDVCTESTDNSTNNIKEAVSGKKEEKKLLERWDIIKEALISVKDEELRAKALQALRDCGIGIAKHVPITPPENLKTVHDSQIQTDVFGLIEKENFILVKEDVPMLERIQQKEQSETTCTIGSKVQSTVTQRVNLNNKDCLSNKCLLLQEELQDFDNVFNQTKHNNARRVEKILTEPSYSVCATISMQLKRDFEALQEWDEEGLLCIHRAVVNNKLQELKRLMLVLKACRISIDVLTENDKSCLELAILTNASEPIVKLLLEAGAKPVTSEPLHESAVIIACKRSSPMLSILLQYVKDQELLNKVDSSGLAPLHYCAMNGNLEGINALLKTTINVNLKDNRSGRTPIFHAIENKHVSVAQKLLAHGAVANIQNFAGQSVTTIVEETKSLSLRTALKQIL
ncbi:uncharacterized protein LOC143218827 [Lasioglossum baleicum]|uniref:uncharacterized protein LOC143218827 n=1 Tax=Lasioglossum baleicum TaxID=434251 RepID=UPI003FCC65C2